MNFKFAISFILLLILCGCSRDLTKNKSEICEVHNVQMNKVTVDIEYGKMNYNPELRKEMVSKFPHSSTFVEGGCVVGWKQWEKIYQCPKCLEARKEYLDKNPQK